MGGVAKIGRLVSLECWCCGCRSRPAPDEPTAARWAYLGHWDVPGQLPDGTPYEGYVRCPVCAKADRWPLECDGWFDEKGALAFPRIRLADGDHAAPDALIASGPEPC